LTSYGNRSGRSGVVAFEVGEDRRSIAVQFKDGSRYTYTEASVGNAHLGVLIGLAYAGQGLNRYINKNVKYRYASRG
jgi:hypothetical protein